MPSSFFLSLFFLTPALVLADDDKGAKNPTESIEKMIAAGSVEGKLVDLYPATKELTLEVSYTVAVQSPNHANKVARKKLEVAKAGQIKDPLKRERRLAELALDMRRLEAQAVRVEKKSHTLSLQASDNTKVRLMRPPTAYDDKGNFKNLTKDELHDLKGPDKTLPGYNGDFSNLKKGQMVRAVLVKQNASAKPQRKEQKKAANGKPQVGMIVVLK